MPSREFASSKTLTNINAFGGHSADNLFIG